MAVVAAIVIAVIYQQRQAQVVRKVRRGFAASDEQARAAALGQLEQEDPAFDPAGFCGSVRKGFEKVQAAWSAMQLEPIRPFVSDGVFERFSLQIEEMKALGYRNVVENLRILSVQIVQIQLDDAFATISVRLSASARDSDVSLKDGRQLRDNGKGEFAEVWSFLRRRGVKTPQAGGLALIAGNCPNCGAAVELNQHARCKQCNAVLRCGQYDWVLAEITQDCEWSPAGDRQIPGLATLRQRDAALNVQAMEDLASVVFWRKMAAERLGDDKPLRKMAAEEFCQRYSKNLGGPFYADCGVGGVDLRGMVPGQEADVADRALVEIAWSGKRYARDPQGGFTEGDAGGVIQQIFVFSRDSAATTNLDNAISSAHCPNCGGPMMQETSAACEFCGQVLNDGKHCWVLTDVLPRSSTAAQDLLRQAAGAAAGDGGMTLPRATAAMGWVIKVAMADGVLDPREEAVLYQIAQKRRVPRQQVQALIEAAKAGQSALTEPAGRDEANAWLDLMIEASFADGKMSAEEMRVLKGLAIKQGFTQLEFDLLVNRVRARLIQAARAAR